MSLRASTSPPVASFAVLTAGGCQRALVGVALVLVTVVMAALQTNTFALHVGMSAVHDAVHASTASNGSVHSAGPAVAARGAAGTVIPADPATDAAEHREASGPVASAHGAPADGGMHLLHLLGACLALLAVGVALTAAARAGSTRPQAAPTSPASPASTPRRWPDWTGPPALSPPTTSPVLRT